MTGPRIIEIDDLNDFFNKMREGEAEANAHLHPCQEELRDDDKHDRYWARTWEGIEIFGDAYSARRARQSEVDAGASKVEADNSARSLADSRKRGYVFGKAYSVITPEGELGSSHVYDLMPIPHSTFEKARQAGWSTKEARDPILNARRETLRLALQEIAMRHTEGQEVPR